MIKSSALLYLACIGAAFGAIYGAYGFLRSVPESEVSGQEVRQEQRSKSLWTIRRRGDPEGGGYELHEIATTYTVHVPVGGQQPQKKEEPVWTALIDEHMRRESTAAAFEIVDGIHDPEQRAEALAQVLDGLASRPPIADDVYSFGAPPLPSVAPYNFGSSEESKTPDEQQVVSAEEREKQEKERARSIEAERQEKLKEFVAQTEEYVSHGLKVIETLPDSQQKVRVLIQMAGLQDSLDMKGAASESLSDAWHVFNTIQDAHSGIWATTKVFLASVVGWAATVGLTTYLAGLFVKVIGFYFVETLATKVGDERFAKALGTTLKTTISESGLILPERLQKRSE